METILCKIWDKNCYWICCPGSFNSPRQQIEPHPTCWQYSLINYPDKDDDTDNEDDEPKDQEENVQNKESKKRKKKELDKAGRKYPKYHQETEQ